MTENKNLTHKLKDNQQENQYELHIGESIAKIEYIKAQGKIFLTHTEVPKQMEGQGIGSSIVKKALEDIQRQDLVLVPLCPFIASYLKRHPEWKMLL